MTLIIYAIIIFRHSQYPIMAIATNDHYRDSVGDRTPEGCPYFLPVSEECNGT